MSPVFVITALLWLSVAGLAFAVFKRFRLLREGRATPARAYGFGNLLSSRSVISSISTMSSRGIRT